MNFIAVFYVILLISASVLCIALVVFLSRISKTVKEIEIEIKELTFEMKPLFASAMNLSEKLNQLSDFVDDQLLVTNNIITKVSDVVDTVLNFEEKLRSGLEGPVLDFVKGFSAISNGISTFWKVYRRR
ncbi:MAG: DUF948 domain-containing protein [Ignavibacteriaceae bacterium]|nr:DUF948 domain-containing protein [Ignavibacteriaceae bacterium]